MIDCLNQYLQFAIITITSTLERSLLGIYLPYRPPVASVGRSLFHREPAAWTRLSIYLINRRPTLADSGGSLSRTFRSQQSSVATSTYLWLKQMWRSVENKTVKFFSNTWRYRFSCWEYWWLLPANEFAHFPPLLNKKVR